MRALMYSIICMLCSVCFCFAGNDSSLVLQKEAAVVEKTNWTETIAIQASPVIFDLWQINETKSEEEVGGIVKKVLDQVQKIREEAEKNNIIVHC